MVALKFFTVLNISLSFRIFEQLAIALKNGGSMEFFTALKYFLSSRVFEQLLLALKIDKDIIFFWNHSKYKTLREESGGTWHIMSPRLKNWGDTSPVSPTKLHPWIKAWPPNKNLHFHFGCHLCKINEHTAILRMFPHIFPTFRHILPEFKGILPGFLPIQIFGVPLEPLRPSLLHQWLRSCKGFMHNKTRVFIQWRTFLEGTLNQSLEPSSTKNLYQCYLKPTFKMLQIYLLCP